MKKKIYRRTNHAVLEEAKTGLKIYRKNVTLSTAGQVTTETIRRYIMECQGK